MKKSEQHFWPFSKKSSVISSIVTLSIFIIILKIVFGWPSKNSESIIIIGAIILSLLPIIFALIDVIIEKGIAFEVYGIKIDFSKVVEKQVTFTIPANIGVRSEKVNDSNTANIIESLRHAALADTVVIDLEDGDAWWETRLVILLAGAERLKKPEKIVFVSTNAGVKQCFQAWAYCNELLPLLLKEDPIYERSILVSKASSRQWELVEPLFPNPDDNITKAPDPFFWMTGQNSTAHGWMTISYKTQLPNDFFAEQLLAYELGNRIELLEGGIREINLTRLEQLFHTVLRKQIVDESWPENRKKETFFGTREPYIAITNYTRYSGIVSRLDVLNEIIKNIVLPKKDK